MNQIPNIEETHNTEVEEFYKKIDDYYRENFDESQPKKKMYITEILHHQLQKAREGERERIKRDLLSYKGTLCSRDREYNADCSICTKTCRLILDCDEIEAIIDHSELDKPTV